MEYTVKRSDRKTLALHVTDEAALVARAPAGMPPHVIEDFIRQKNDWITAHIAAKAAQAAAKSSFCLDYGSSVLFRGKECAIAPSADGRAGFDGERFFLPPGLDSDTIIRNIRHIYIQLAKILLSEKTAKAAEKMSLSPPPVRISSAKTCWGSCGGKGISYSWRLVLADDGAINYVVVHELAHIFHRNHGSGFGRVVGAVVPDYKLQTQKLRKLQKRLEAERWD